MPTYCIVSDDENRSQGMVLAVGVNIYNTGDSLGNPDDIFQTEFKLTRVEDAYLLMDDSSTKLWIATFFPNQSFDYDAKTKIMRCSKIVLTDPYSLHDVATYRETYFGHILQVSLDNLSLHQALDVLEWIKLDSPHMDSLYSTKAIDVASETGCIDVLNWWLKSNLPLKYTARAINSATLEGRLDVLNWWIESKLPLKYSDEIPMLVAPMGHITVLDWWVEHKLSIRVSLDVFLNASIINKNIQILEWWKNFVVGFPDKIKFECPAGVIDAASRFGYIDVLDWWLGVHHKYGIQLVYTEYAIDYASADGVVEVLEWWKNSDLPLIYTTSAVDKSLSGHHHRKILDWWDQSDLEMRYTHLSMDYASMIGHIPVLDWWMHSRHETLYSKNAFTNASKFDQLDVLIWWLDSGLKITKPSRRELKTYSVRIREWWSKNYDSYLYSSDNNDNDSEYSSDTESVIINYEQPEIEPEPLPCLTKLNSREHVIQPKTVYGIKLDHSLITYTTMFVALSIWYAGIYYLWKHRRIYTIFSWNRIKTFIKLLDPRRALTAITFRQS